jgi:hypothetical protein
MWNAAAAGGPDGYGLRDWKTEWVFGGTAHLKRGTNTFQLLLLDGLHEPLANIELSFVQLEIKVPTP